MRYGKGGGSGTDGSTIIVAEQLAAHGCDVVILMEKLEPLLETRYAEKGIFFNPGKKIRGVTYSNFELEGVDNKEFDIWVNSLWFQKYKELPVKITKAMIYWCHMQWIYGILELKEYAEINNLKLGFVNISEWERSINAPIINDTAQKIPHTKSTLIPNPIMDDIIEEILSENIEKKSGTFVFHPLWSRGGNVAVEAVRQLNFPEKEFHAFDYLMCIHGHTDPFFHMHNGVDKRTLFRYLAKADYFVYPLYTPYQDVHKDTFSCVVAEAIAMGVTVVTYPLGALPENFDGYCAWLDFPEGVDRIKIQSESLTKDIDGKFKCTDNIVRKIEWLEKNPELKNKVRAQGKDYIFEKFNSKKVGLMWKNFIAELLR
jgi:glycosyltransferase involved in cell wall biosynthesis